MKPGKHPGQIRGLLLGEQKSGKSTRERVWTDEIIQWSFRGVDVVRCTLVFDRNREDVIWSGAGPVVSDLDDFWRVANEMSKEAGAENIHLPPRVIVRAGMDVGGYVNFLELAIDEGDFLVVFCEGSDWAPSRGQWPVDKIARGVRLEHLFRQGRHIPDRDGEPQHFHYILDTQEAIGLSPLIRNEANLVATGPLEGSNNLRWVNQNFGQDGSSLAVRAQSLGPHEWLILRNKMDKRVPKFPLTVDL